VGYGICLLSGEASALSVIEPALSRRGVPVWTADSANTFFASGRAADTICIVVDGPGDTGLEQIELLRDGGARQPVVLIAETALPRKRLLDAFVLDVLSQPIDRKALLGWIECVCLANLALSRRLARAA